MGRRSLLLALCGRAVQCFGEAGAGGKKRKKKPSEPWVPKNNDNTLGCEHAGIIAVHYVCSIYTSSQSPTSADG